MNAEEVALLIGAPLLQMMLWRCALEPQSSRKMDPERYLDAHLDMLRHGLDAKAK
ncbi:hypothetical protein D3C83_38110 [compost metagenome]